MISSSPNHNIFKNIPFKSNLQALPYYPYKTQNFRQNNTKNRQALTIKDQMNNLIQKYSFQKDKINQLTIASPNISLNIQQPIKTVFSIKKQRIDQNKGTSLLKSYLRQQNRPSRVFINQQQEQNSSSQQKETNFRKTFCSSFNSRIKDKNLSLELKSQQKRPPTSQIQSYKPSTRIRKISNIDQQSNENFLAKYEIIKQLGKGTYGTVYLAKIIKKNNLNNTLNLSFFNKTMNIPWINKDKVKMIQQRIDQNRSQLTIKSNFYNDTQNKSIILNQKNQQSTIIKKCQQNESKIIQLQLQPTQNDQIQNMQQSIKSIQQQKTKNQQLNSLSNDELVAIKVYQKFKMNKDPSKFKNIRKQITIMQNLCHKGVIKLYQSVQSITKISLVVQYGGQSSLLDYLRKNFPLNKDKLKDFSKQLLQTIAYLHDKNIVHRDIKPQNILIKQTKQPDGTLLEELKLIDYGFSTLTNKSRKLNAICGTPNFMAPQLLSSKQYFGQKVDVWSYGIVIFVMAQGRHPFKSNQYQQLQRLVNKGKFSFKRKHQQSFQQFINSILKVNSNQRPTATQIIKYKWLNQQ